jgi:hypothetical protein
MPDTSPAADPDALARLRCTAALLACTPALSARLRWADRTVLEIVRPPHPERDHVVLPPCWFRAFLADALRHGVPDELVQRERMERLLACAVDLGTRDGAAVLPGDVVRVPVGHTWMHLLAVSSPVEEVRPIVRSAREPVAEGLPAPGLHAATDLDATVLSLGSADDGPASERAAEALRHLAMLVAIHRLERGSDAASDHPARRRGD